MRNYLAFPLLAALFVAAHGIPHPQGWSSPPAGWTTPPEGWTAPPASGWGAASPSDGNTQSYGQTILIDNAQAVNTISSPISLVADASDSSIAESHVDTSITPHNDLYTYPAATEVVSGDAGIYNVAPYFEQYGTGWAGNTVNVYNAAHSEINTDAEGISALSDGQIGQSAWGQITHGTNVAPVSSGGGWKAETPKAGWGSGWGANNNGTTVSAAETSLVQNATQLVGVSDDISVVAVGDGITPMQMDNSVNMSLVQDQIVENDGFVIATGANAGDAYIINGGEYLEQYSVPELEAAVTTSNADSINYSATPNVTSYGAMGGVVMSDWGTVNSGQNLTGTGSGWGSGWKQS